MEDPAIVVSGVSKSFKLPYEKPASLKSLVVSNFRRKRGYKLQEALKDISFEVKKGEFFGVVGRNGSGKSTLLKLIANIYQPTEGGVKVNGRLVPFIELGVGFNPELTGRENVFLNGALLGFSRKEVRAMYNEIVEFAELEKFMDQKLKNYSSGMQVRLAFSTAIRADADVLLVDEVLAVGDAEFQRKCFGYFKQLKANKKTVVFVTHDMNSVREYCDRAILIEDGQIKLEGRAEKVSLAYTKLFFNEEKKTQKTTQKRWGNRDVTIDKVTVTPSTLLDANKDIQITIDIKAHKDITGPVVGFLVKNQAAQPILGTNSQIELKKIESMSAGQSRRLIWTVPHVFSRGLYYIDPSVIDGSTTEVYDWWEEAERFVVHKDKLTPYIVNPLFDLKIEKHE